MADSSAKWELSFEWIRLDFSICLWPTFELLLKVVVVMMVVGDGGSGDDGSHGANGCSGSGDGVCDGGR